MSEPTIAPALLRELDGLVSETCGLWDAGWVGFNWRAYTYDHVQRVRRLALRLGEEEDSDPQVLELAALLHDLTKPYDGETLTDAGGQRVVDAQGYWRNSLRPPSRQNEVTLLYDALSLAGEPHNRSGAAVARALLERRGLPGTLVERVARTIEDHLLPAESAAVESRCLYDADTIDANIGLPAFARNIYINLRYYGRRNPGAPPIDALLAEDPTAFLRPYIGEQLPSWAHGKAQDFVPKLLTEAGRWLALERLRRLGGWFDRFAEQMQTGDLSGGCLGALLFLMRRRDDPSIAAVTAELAAQTGSSGDGCVAALLGDLLQEMDGAL